MKHFSVITLAALGVLLVTAPSALAADTLCSTLVGPPTYANTNFLTINGNLVVDLPNCELTGGGTVSGNVTVRAGNSLELDHQWVIAGDLKATNCAFVNLNDHGPYPPFPPGTTYTTTIGGNVDIDSCSGGLGIYWAFFNQPGTVIMGNFTCQNNTVACYLQGATIGGNVTISNNNYPVPVPIHPYTSISNNIIINNLKCQNNSPTPLVGAGTNTVLGNPAANSEGQCIGF
jgi:hypothetical protein